MHLALKVRRVSMGLRTPQRRFWPSWCLWMDLAPGLDADLLDGSHASAFALLSGAIFSGTVTAPNFVSSSDARLKSDISPIADALARVQALTGVTFTMAGSGGRQMGLIAQHVQSVAPEVVVEADGMLRLAYGNLVGLLVEAIKDLATQVDQLKRAVP